MMMMDFVVEIAVVGAATAGTIGDIGTIRGGMVAAVGIMLAVVDTIEIEKIGVVVDVMIMVIGEEEEAMIGDGNEDILPMVMAAVGRLQHYQPKMIYMKKLGDANEKL